MLPGVMQIKRGSGIAVVTITTSSLNSMVQNSAFSQQLNATGGTSYTWSVVSGSLPAGLNLSSGGLLSGTPTGTGAYSFTAKCQDVTGGYAQQAYSGSVTQTQFSTVISATTTNVNMATLFGNPSGGAGYTYTVTINSGVVVYSTATGTPAFDVGSMPSGASLSLINNGSIYGKGGNGGNGGFLSNNNGQTGGSAGGNAINTTKPISITNNGTIGGGGGGGTGGAGDENSGGSGGGGGQSYSNSSGGLGSNGVANGQAGTITKGGDSGNISGNGGTAGVAGSYIGIYNWAGGGGGGFGAAGGPDVWGLAGGAAGKAVNANGQTITWLANGTRYGALS